MFYKLRYIVGRFHNFLQKKISTSIPFRAFPHPISLSYFEKVIAIYQSRAFLLSSTARTRELFFAVSRAAERRVVGRGTRRWPIVHHISMPPSLVCIAVVAADAENESKLSFRYELDLGSFQLLDDTASFNLSLVLHVQIITFLSKAWKILVKREKKFFKNFIIKY